MYLKIIGGIFLMSAAASIGFLKAEELNERVKRLKGLKHMIVLLQGELRFRRAALSEAFENISERVEAPFDTFAKELAERLEMRGNGDFETVWSEMSGRLLGTEGFLKEDEALLEILKSSLGYLDLTMQMETLNLAMMQTEEAISTAAAQQEKKGRLYRTMGVSVGALLTLLII